MKELTTQSAAGGGLWSGHPVTLDEFDGPLDFLMSLIKKNDVNIYDIPIARITGQFLEYLDYAVKVDLRKLTDFYEMASDLLFIKARMLLPTETDFEEDEREDPRQELVEKLIEYQKFRKLSGLMAEKDAQQDWNLEREKLQRMLPFEDGALWDRLDTWDLLQDMQQLFKKLVSSASQERIIDLYEEVTVNEKITLIQEFLETKGECFLTDLIIRIGSILEAVCAFMAILEAVRTKTVSIYQNRMFGDIKICPYQAA
jgi:segregation and condensation protein A